MMKVSILCGLVAIFAGSSLAAQQSTDSLSAARLSAISVAFEMASADPLMDVDRLSPTRVAAISAAYETHDPRPEVDRLGAAGVEIILKAYESYDAAGGAVTYVGN